MPCCSGSSCWVLREPRDLVLSRESTQQDRISTGRASQRDPPDRDNRESRWMAGEGSGIHPVVTAHPPCEPGWGSGALPNSCIQHPSLWDVFSCSWRCMGWQSGCCFPAPVAGDGELQDPVLERSRIP